MKRSLAVFILALAAVVASAQPKPQDVAATVNGEVITMAQLDSLFAGLSPQMRDNYNRSGGKLAFLQNYIERRLVVQEALKADLDKRPHVRDAILAARDNVLFDRYVREVIAPEVVPEGDLRAFYESHKEEFRKPERVRARHIIVSPEATPGVVNETGSDAATDDAALAKITRIATQIRGGELTFIDAARAYSEDSAATEGGDVGWFAHGAMVPPFEVAAFKLAKGQMSPIVKTQFGYHLILVTDREAGGLAPYEEVKGDITEAVYAEKAGEILAQVGRLTRELVRDSKVNISLTE